MRGPYSSLRLLLLILGVVAAVAAGRSALPLAPQVSVSQAAGGSEQSVDDRFTVAGVQMRLPDVFPFGYRPAASDRQRNINNPAVDVLLNTFRDSDGHYLRIRQGWPVPYEDTTYATARERDRGTVSIQDNTGLWVRTGGLALRWQSGARTPEGERIGYALEADALPLDDLVALAKLMQPYPSPTAPTFVPPLFVPSRNVSPERIPVPPEALIEGRGVSLGHVEVQAIRAFPTPPPGPRAPLVRVIAPEVSLDEAARLANFVIVVPKWLPEPKPPLYLQQILEGVNTWVRFYYRETDFLPRASSLREFFVSEQRWTGVSPLYVTGDLEQVSVAGRPGAMVVSPSLGVPSQIQSFRTSTLWWERGDLLITIYGLGYSQSDLIRVAEALEEYRP